MKNTLCGIAVLLSLALVSISCQKSATHSAARQYAIVGKVVSVDRQRSTVTLDHEDIPGLMQAMEMEFKVNKPELLEGLQAGDEVQGQLDVQDGNQVLSSLSKR